MKHLLLTFLLCFLLIGCSDSFKSSTEYYLCSEGSQFKLKGKKLYRLNSSKKEWREYKPNEVNITEDRILISMESDRTIIIERVTFILSGGKGVRSYYIDEEGTEEIGCRVGTKVSN